MSRQYDSLAFTDDKLKCVITCMCGSVEHGALVVNKDKADDEFYISFSISPWHWKFLDRLKNAIRAFRGQTFDGDLVVTKEDAKKLAAWLAD